MMGKSDAGAREDEVAVRIVSADRQDALAERLRRAGRAVEPDGAVVLVDGVPAEALVAGAGRDAGIVALVDGEAAAAAALAAGATHLHPAGDLDGLAAAVAAAARHVVRLTDARGSAPGERRHRMEAIAGWTEQRLAGGVPVTALHVSLTRLDLINAAHGREVGTRVVAAAERRVRSVVEALADDEARVARVSGPAFVAVLAGSPDAAVLAAARIEEALGRPLRIDDTAIALGVRIGIAGGRPGDTAEALLVRTERSGEGEERLAAPAGIGGDEEALAIDVHHALARGEVTLRFQPQASLRTGEIVGVEALARWEHPARGPLGAVALFAAAEQAGIGLALSDHIQRLVLARAGGWPASLAHLRVSLNLTAADLARTRFAEVFLDHLDASGFPRGRLTLEITETGLMADLEAAAALLATLRGAGCRIAIDDFGTGYSSLAYLKALPIDYLKLDKSLAQDIDGSERDRVVVTGAIDMARSLGIAVIAEGVETPAQRDLLAAHGCALFQGFLLAEPLEEAALVRLVEERA